MYKRLERNDPCWCGSGKKYKSCHAAFDDKLIHYEHEGFIIPDRGLFKTAKDIEGIKKSAVINMAVLDEIGEKIHAGMSTQEILLNSKMLDNEVRQMQEQAEAVAAEGGDKGDEAGGGDDLGF